MEIDNTQTVKNERVARNSDQKSAIPEASWKKKRARRRVVGCAFNVSKYSAGFHRMTYPFRRVLADMCVETTRAGMTGNITGLKLGYKFGAEIGHRKYLTAETAERVKRNFSCGAGTAVGCLSFVTVALPWGVGVACWNLFSGSTVKTAILGDIEKVRDAGFGEVHTVVEELFEKATEYVEKVDNDIEMRGEKLD